MKKSRANELIEITSNSETSKAVIIELLKEHPSHVSDEECCTLPDLREVTRPASLYEAVAARSNLDDELIAMLTSFGDQIDLAVQLDYLIFLTKNEGLNEGNLRRLFDAYFGLFPDEQLTEFFSLIHSHAKSSKKFRSEIEESIEDEYGESWEDLLAQFGLDE